MRSPDQSTPPGRCVPSLLRRAGRAAIAGLGAACVLLSTGCEVDTFMDPSFTGRWEETPTIVPVLDRIASIEDEPIEVVQRSAIQPSDLVPEVEEYQLAAADQLEIRIRDFFQVGLEDIFQVIVDQRGYIEIPRLGSFRITGRTKPEVTAMIEDRIREMQINQNPVVTVTLLSQRKQTFSVLGAVQSPGSYFIPAADYRLLEGITAAGGIDETVKSIYVIRQVPLSDAAAGIVPPDAPRREPEGWDATPGRRPDNVRPTTPPDQGEDLIDLIDELSGQKAQPDKPSPGALSRRSAQPRRDEPDLIDLPDSPGARPRPAQRAPDEPDPARGVQSEFVFEDGRWTRRVGTGDSTEALVTQRVIVVPVEPLLAGAADVNIVLRPGDVVRVPPNRTGLVYITGQVNRPGPYALPTDSRLTLMRSFDAAGGLAAIAIPERVDITRMVGEDRQATIRVNARAIAEGTQPDLFLKADDRVNVGTNFFAFPLAIIRNGFRMSYGFGFLLDRNFGNDVFGPPPDSDGF